MILEAGNPARIKSIKTGAVDANHRSIHIVNGFSLKAVLTLGLPLGVRLGAKTTVLP
jgi:hypothetical protein